MDIQIKYCATCGLAGRARSLAQKVKSELGLEARISPGRLAQFDVFADGQLIASRDPGIVKHLTHRGWPDENAVIERLRQHAAQAGPSSRRD
jgi:predicted Rdx family selenoprotein